MFSTNGSMNSYQVMRMRSSSDSTISVVVEWGSPMRSKTLAMIGMSVSANAGKSSVSMVRCSQRATAALSL